MTPAARELARRNLLAFTLATKPDYSAGWVHREICGELMRFYAAVLRKESPRLILTMPPRHGKSEIVSRRFPSFCFGVTPDIGIIAASYDMSLAVAMSRDVQGIMRSEEYREIFPHVNLTETRRRRNAVNATQSSKLFEIPGFAGRYIAAGVGTGITGKGADILSIDDPIKGRKEADSPTVRETVANWYGADAYTRLAPGGGILVTQTRWHEDDLAGRLIDRMGQGGDRWTVINYPAIAERDEPHRKEGEALHPERYPLQALQRIRANIGEYDWNALYQQRPTPRAGGVFRREWVRHWTSLPRVPDQVIQSWDFAFKDAKTSDNVSGQLWMRAGARFYLVDCVTRKMSYVEQKAALRRMTEDYPQAWAKVVEDKANGPAIISDLESTIPGIVPYTPLGSKLARAYSVSPFFEAGNVFVPPADAEHPWVSKYLEELCTFPSAPHDDRVDATSQALDYLARRGTGVAAVL